MCGSLLQLPLLLLLLPLLPLQLLLLLMMMIATTSTTIFTTTTTTTITASPTIITTPQHTVKTTNALEGRKHKSSPQGYPPRSLTGLLLLPLLLLVIPPMGKKMEIKLRRTSTQFLNWTGCQSTDTWRTSAGKLRDEDVCRKKPSFQITVSAGEEDKICGWQSATTAATAAATVAAAAVLLLLLLLLLVLLLLLLRLLMLLLLLLLLLLLC